MILSKQSTPFLPDEGKNNRGQFRLLFEHNPLPMWVYDLATLRFLEVNDAATEAYGYSREEFLGMTIRDIRPAEEVGKLVRNIKRRRPAIEHSGIWTHRRRDGSLIQVEITSHLTEFQGRKAAVVVAYDVTEHKQAEMLQAAVYRIASAAVTAASLDDLYAEIHRTISGVMNAENFYITIYDAERDVLTFPYFRDSLDEPYMKDVPPAKGLTAFVLRTGKSLLCTQAVHDELERRGEVRLLGAPSSIWLGVPLIVQEKVIGAMVVQHYSNPAAYGEREQHMLEFVSAQVAAAINRQQADAALREREARYRALFEDSPVALWEEDFSAVKLKLDELRRAGITDLREHFASHPEFVDECVRSVRVTDVNKATLQLFGAREKPELLDSLARFMNAEALRAYQDELVAIADGTTQASWLGSNQTLDGRRLEINLRWSVVPGYEQTLEKVLVSMEDITDRRRSEGRIQRQLRYLGALRDIDQAISSTYGIAGSMDTLLMQLTTHLEVDAADVMLFKPELQLLSYAAVRGFRDPSFGRGTLRLGEGYAGRAALERTPTFIPDLRARTDNPRLAKAISGEAFVSYFGVPLMAKGKVAGVLEVFHRALLQPDQEWMDLLQTLAGQAALALDNGSLFESLQRSNLELKLAYDATIAGWSRALDLRDKETEGHTERVAELTLKLASQFGFTDEQLLHVRRGALLHDIGKMGVPDGILLKPSALTEDEWTIMRRHPQFAYDMLSPLQYLRPAVEIPYCHHEKWDGSGYPRGLRGDQIPLEARIFAVIDVWDALISDRPYRKAWPKAQALEYIKSSAGSHFDPQVVQAFLHLHALLLE